MDFLETVYDPISRIPAYEVPSDSKEVLILIPQSEDYQLTIILFSKMLDRLGYAMADKCHVLSIVPLHRYFYHQLSHDFGFNKLILCGISPEILGLQSALPIHIPVHLDGTFLLRTDAPGLLEKSDANHRGAFWHAFKSAFGQ
jgi:hypothetical protein